MLILICFGAFVIFLFALVVKAPGTNKMIDARCRRFPVKVAFNRQEPSPAETLESIRHLHLKGVLNQILATYPLPARRGAQG